MSRRSRRSIWEPANLIEQGHRHVCFLRPLARNPVKGNRSLDAVEEERLIGYRIAMQASGLEPWLVEYVHRGDAGRETLLRLMGRRPAPSAFVGMGDHLAVQVSKLLAGLGYRIPEEVSLVGIGHYAAEFLPGMQISSVDFNHGRLGTEAAELFLENLRDLHAPPLRRVLAVELKLRHSAAPPPLAPA